jgi:hypothetical protein
LEPARRAGIAVNMSRKSLWTLIVAASCVALFAYAFAINSG